MQVKMSDFLNEHRELLKELIEDLKKDFQYVSVLGTDTQGKSYSVQNTGVSLDDSGLNERGFVVRVYNGKNYSEFSFNQLSRESLPEICRLIKNDLIKDFEELRSAGVSLNTYPLIKEDEERESFFTEVKFLPEDISPEEKLERMAAIKEKAFRLTEYLVDFRVIYQEVRISKLFISPKKELEQSYIISEGNLVAIVRREGNVRYYYKTFSGQKGSELLEEMEDKYEDVVKTAVELLDAETIKPGVYDVICDPDMAGVIAHEAFGHGVEMDMFVKERAKAVDYLGKEVASPLVTMHDGSRATNHVASYLFDDEGVRGTDTVVIKDGILKSGISDLLSALKLGTDPTGNGRRESFERKAYARMTNTFFAPGDNTLDEMIASVESGYLLEGVMSGMEDPKNWGIQCVALLGREIKDGRLTGKLVSPVIMTGYVPEVLKSISMVSADVEMSGVGYCGKGYKELVKVSCGGPYIKAKVRLG